MENNEKDDSHIRFERAMIKRIAAVDNKSKDFKKNFKMICNELLLPAGFVEILIKVSIAHTACFTYTCINDAYREIKYIEEKKAIN